MRYIPIEDLEKRSTGDWPSAKWQERARKAQDELRNAPDGKARAAIFKKYSDLWSELKKDFRGLSHSKCWYCEVSTDGMRGDMDHHRPKGKVTENPDHPGYWWLAFNWHNFRFSCERCNSYLTDDETKIVGGKGNYFPLVNNDETGRIWQECDYEDLFMEDPLLLDPTNPDDPRLLTFRSDGRPGPASADENSVDYQRAKRSIEIYDLYHTVANKKRKKIYYKVRDLLRKYQRYQIHLQKDRRDLAAREGIQQVLLELRELIEEPAEYSSAARAYLDMHKNRGPEWAWINSWTLTVA